MSNEFAPRCPFCSTILAADDPYGDRHTCDTAPALDMVEARRWLQLAYPSGRPELFHIGAPTPDRRWKGKGFSSLFDLVRHVAKLDQDNPTGIYVAACTLRPDAGDGRKRTDAAWLYGIWSDIDIDGPGHKHDPAKHGGRPLPPDEDAARKIVGAAGLPDPTVWIHSGGGLYAWWLLDQPAPAQEHADTVKVWQEALHRGAESLGYHYGTEVYDLARVLRLPGTVNRKVPDRPRPCRILTDDGPRYTIDQLVEVAGRVTPPPAPRPSTPAPAGPFTAPGRHDQDDDTPLNAYERATDWADILGPHGWTLHHTDRDGTRYWERPGGSTTGGHSASTGRDSGRDRMYVFSTDAGLPAMTSLNKGYVYALLNHAGDVNAAARDLYRQGYGARREAGAQRDYRCETPAADVDGFWTARPALAHLHTFARARRVAPWAVLGAVLARIVAATQPTVQLPPTIGSYASLNLFVGLVGPPGSGKDAAAKVAKDAVEIPHNPFMTAPVGSGEGIAHMFMRRRKDGDQWITEQYNTATLVTIGEIDTLTALARRQSSTIGSQLRQAAMGEQLGFFYVDSDKRMIVPEHEYRLCLLAGIQPARAGALLDDADGGTPQRFVWLPATDPEAPDEAPPCPDPRVWRSPVWHGHTHAGGRAQVPVKVCQAATDTIVAAHLARTRGTGDALDGHALLTRLKVAAALAILDGHPEIRDDDWHLSGAVMEVSDHTRGTVAAALDAENAKRNLRQAEAEAARTITVQERVSDHAVQQACQAITRKLAREADWITRSELRKSLRIGLRQHFEAAADLLTAAGQIEADEFDYQGRAGVRYRARRDG